MAEQRSNPSRRNVMRAAARLATAGLWSGIAHAEASDEMTRQQAEYQDTPNGVYSCGLCTLFEPPAGCKVVEGEVAKDDGRLGRRLAPPRCSR